MEAGVACRAPVAAAGPTKARGPDLKSLIKEAEKAQKKRCAMLVVVDILHYCVQHLRMLQACVCSLTYGSMAGVKVLV